MDGALSEAGIDLEELLRQISEQMGQMDAGDLNLSELAKALLTQDLASLENLIREAAEAAGIDRIENMLQVGFFSRRTAEQMGMEGATGPVGGLDAATGRLRHVSGPDCSDEGADWALDGDASAIRAQLYGA